MKKTAKRPAAKKTAPARKKTAAAKPARPATKTPRKSSKSAEEKGFPGYPHYAATEDIMNTPGEEQIALDMENAEHPVIREKRREEPTTDVPPGSYDDLDEDEDFVNGNVADVTPAEAKELGDPNLAMDMGDDEDLKNRPFEVDMTGQDLVVPGAELDDEDEEIGNEDEENNLYSPSQS